MVGVAVKVAAIPEHIGLVPAVNAMETDGVKLAATTIVIAFDVAVTGLAQARFEVITHVTICPLVNVLVVKVGLLVPAFTPFTFH